MPYPYVGIGHDGIVIVLDAFTSEFRLRQRAPQVRIATPQKLGATYEPTSTLQDSSMSGGIQQRGGLVEVLRVLLLLIPGRTKKKRILLLTQRPTGGGVST